MACTWFGEICSCCYLTVLLGPAWVLLSKIYNPFAGSMYKGVVPLSMHFTLINPLLGLQGTVQKRGLLD